MTLTPHSASSDPRVVPAPVGALLARLPAYPGSLLVVTALNLALARHLPDDVGRLLLHKKMRVQVRDARVAFDFAWTGQRFAPHAPLVAPAVADVTLGDTELGLVVKNALDAIELPVLDPRQWVPRQLPTPRQVLARVRQHLQATHRRAG